uniref:G_PROTEIN_RECEP_F1_2 domain-containing protein n=1 Tax=Steinernema glaseri TaxID=37863 RepID=A0A1I8A1V4_9BILA
MAFFIQDSLSCLLQYVEAVTALETSLARKLDKLEAFLSILESQPDLAACVQSSMEDSEAGSSGVLIVLVLVVFVNFLGAVIFAAVRRYNQHRWKKDMARKLSHRYQIMENIRTSKQLLKVVVADFIITFYFAVVLYYQVQGGGNTLSQVLGASFDLVAAVSAVLLPVLFIT